ncbi:MAG: hypothetical protein WC082_01815 [Victivallales bacterium]|jgi:hypothetical protein
MKSIKEIIKILLIGWGILCFTGAIVIGCILLYEFTLGNRPRIGNVGAKDVRYVLNWCRLGDNRIKEVIHSYQSSRSFTGDHLDAYAIKISNVSISELTNPDWCRGDKVEGILNDALTFTGAWRNQEIPWFPSEKELRSKEIYVYPWSIYYHGTRPTAVRLIFVRPKDCMIFFISVKT